jgi:hypothetical protein
MKKNSLVFGTIAGVLISTFMGISMAIMGCGSGEMDAGNSSMIIGFSAMAVSFSFIFVGIKNFRDKQNGGVLPLGKGIVLGLFISLIASTLYVITWAVEFHFFMPDFMDKYAAMQAKQLQESGMSSIALEEALKEIEKTSSDYKHNPLVFALYTYMEILPVGILITLISAFILKRKTPLEVRTT